MSSASSRIAIIGAGFSGLCLGIRLRQAGHRDFTIFEKADRLGGTWRENRYPGAACDAPSFLYCFSFEPKSDWSRKWAPQAEILAYMEHCASKYGLTEQIRFDSEIASARFDAGEGVWVLRTAAGQEVRADVLVSAVGQLQRPRMPELPGLEAFAGQSFHSAAWPFDFDATGRSVGVVGTAASAIQLVPELAKQARRLYVFQRSPSYIAPKRDRVYSERTQRRFARHPWLARLYRWGIWAQLELSYPIMRRGSFLGRRLAPFTRSYMRHKVKDPALRRALVPDYPIGGKRILISDDYYPALVRDNVELVTDAIDHLTQDAVVTRNGSRYPLDALIFATGFRSTEFLVPIEIEGLGGRRLHSEWKDGAEAYLGLAVPGFPNFFMMYGPNTNLGHNSIIFMIECQAGYILQCVRRIAAGRARLLDLRPEVLHDFNRRLQAQLEGSVWAATDGTWYRNAAGRITNNWGYTTLRYWWQTRRVDFGVYRREQR